MKKLYYLICLAFLTSLLIPNTSYAVSHAGSEITWECIPAGQADAGKFIFHLKYYRECYSFDGSKNPPCNNTLTLSTTHPTVSYISMSIVSGWPKDISPKCYLDTGVNVITCSGMDDPAPRRGAIHEYLYSSQPIALSGTPPAGGWAFFHTPPCDSWGYSENIIGHAKPFLKAKMYAFQGKDHFPCFDNSPTFAESPETAICAGSPYQFSNYAYDSEFDLLVYDWGMPMEGINKPVSYKPTYSYRSPLPGLAQDSNNVPASIDTNTGLISFESHTTGTYLTSIKVIAYKQGIKVAEVWRELNITLLSCGQNTPPSVIPPFKNGTSFHDTVYVGDTVHFALNGSDFEFLPDGKPQTMHLEASGEQFGAFIPPKTSGNSGEFISDYGCAHPPCATLYPAPGVDTGGTEYKVSGVFGLQTEFHWETSPSHLTNAKEGKTYHFFMGVRDNFCPAPARNQSHISITVLPRPLSYSPDDKKYIGGEITWECVNTGDNSGSYLFNLNAYFECDSSVIKSIAAFNDSIYLQSDSPADSILLIIEGEPVNISPDCYDQNLRNNNAYSIHYRSQAIKLNGVPPAQGWTFSWSDNSRKAATNMEGDSGIYLRSVMYSYNNQNAFPCLDNSPYFAEMPQASTCTGYPNMYGQLALDKELDDLVYKWDIPMVRKSKPISHKAGYSAQSPLPGTTQDSRNIAATMDSTSGSISFESYTSGSFATSTKVSAYKNGIKTAEIWRDFQLTLQNCGGNTPPDVTPPFNNGISYHDTVFAGDRVQFALNGSDFEFLTTGIPQTMYIEKALGNQFGDFTPPNQGSIFGKLSDSTGCLNPPCATLNPASGTDVNGTKHEASGVFGIQTEFDWQTTCNHLIDATKGKTYQFSVVVRDNFCPSPARNESTISITVLPKPLLSAPKVKSVNFDYNLFTAELQWDAITDTANLFRTYEIYYSNSQQGPFTLIDSIYNINQTSYSHYTGPVENAYFFIKTRNNYCNNQISVNTSDTLNLELTGFAESNNNPEFILYQNKPNPAKDATTIKYFVDREGAGEFMLMDINGQTIMQKVLIATSGNNSFELETSSLAAGVYYYQVSFGDNMGTKRLLIVR